MRLPRAGVIKENYNGAVPPRGCRGCHLAARTPKRRRPALERRTSGKAESVRAESELKF